MHLILNPVPQILIDWVSILKVFLPDSPAHDISLIA